MPRDSQGNFSNIFDWEQDAANGIGIEPDRHQQGDDDQAQGLTDSLDRQGRGGMLAALAMGNNKITGLAVGTAATDGLTLGQAQNQTYLTGSDVGAANAYRVNLAPAVSAYAAGQRVSFQAVNANTGASTLQLNALTPAPALEWNGALVGGEIPAGGWVEAEYDGTAFQILNVPGVLQANQGGTGTTTPLGTAAFEDTGTAVGDVPVFGDDGGGNAQYPAADGQLITGLIEYAWVNFNSTGGILAQSGVSGVVRNSIGDFTVTFTAAWSGNETYTMAGSGRRSSSANDTVNVNVSQAAGAQVTTSMRVTTTDENGALFDPFRTLVQFMGQR